MRGTDDIHARKRNAGHAAVRLFIISCFPSLSCFSFYPLQILLRYASRVRCDCASEPLPAAVSLTPVWFCSEQLPVGTDAHGATCDPPGVCVCESRPGNRSLPPRNLPAHAAPIRPAGPPVLAPSRLVPAHAPLLPWPASRPRCAQKHAAQRQPHPHLSTRLSAFLFLCRTTPKKMKKTRWWLRLRTESQRESARDGECLHH